MRSPSSGSPEAGDRQGGDGRAADVAGLAVVCHVARSSDDLALHFAIREAVFVAEQRFFESTDRDGHDAEPAVLHVLARYGSTPAGTVRLYPLERSGRWKGDRLAVLPPFRKRGVGAPLVRFAVRTAADLGGETMIAHIQPQNVPFFEHLGWRPVGGLVDYVGHVHQLMEIDLTGRGTLRPGGG